MGTYTLADGSLNTQYEVGDTFTVVHHHTQFHMKTIITLQSHPSYEYAVFEGYSYCEGTITTGAAWRKLIPTEETKRKYMKTFTKSDLKDGMKVTYRNGDVRTVLGNNLLYFSQQEFCGNGGWKQATYLSTFNEDLYHRDYKKQDIMKIEDRDGTILFERVEKKTVTLELTTEQIESLLHQGIIFK